MFEGWPSKLLAGTGACALVVVVSLAGACDRVAYYSITGSTGAGDGPDDDDDDGPSSGPPSSAATGIMPVSRGAVLASVATCAQSLYGEISSSAADLDDAAQTFEASPTTENEEAARAAWASTIGLWQQAELLRIGPAGPVTLPQGQSLRDYMYSWPLVSRCLVEQSLVSGKYADDNWALVGLVNTRGLAAAEYLLFYEGNDNACSESSSINTQGTWAALGSSELAQRKREYAAVAAADIAAKAAAIQAGWAGDVGFAVTLASAGEGDSPFASDQAALNAVSDGMFYIEREVKDMKLARPLGISADCPAATCPADVESQYARISRDHVRNNLLGFQRIFEGCDEASEAGFDDLLRSLGAGDLADRMSGDLVGAIAAADALQSSDFVALLASDKASVVLLHTAVKRLTDALKTDFVTILDLELPMNIEGDND